MWAERASEKLPGLRPASVTEPSSGLDEGRSSPSCPAAAFFNEMANPAIARAVPAGTHPADRVHPEVVEVMREAGAACASVVTTSPPFFGAS